MNPRHAAALVVTLVATLFSGIPALAQEESYVLEGHVEDASSLYCGYSHGCNWNISCVQVAPNIVECRTRCYQDMSCRCWTVLCHRKEYTYSAAGNPITIIGSCSVKEPNPPSVFCNSPCEPAQIDCGPGQDGNPNHTPVVIDVDGNGIRLTSAAGGVAFDLDSNGAREQLAWTETGSDDAWLALDRNGNGAIDDGKELFGDLTPQPPSETPNGYRALAVFDYDDDGVIDAADGVWTLLRLWRDTNHDGVAQPWELGSLDSAGITALDLGFKTENRRDRHGNVFRYRAAVWAAKPGSVGHWSYDVLLTR